MPSWANQEKILAFYSLATFLTFITGIQFVVDHIVHLKSKYICGLHAENNLQILTRTANAEKSNKFSPIAGIEGGVN
jgi:hypothetical protein